ncbi:MAG: anion transporter, partial [Alphaproteobacteria bacterium]|nr:anion transporter [Alphaproteobacteria bacterium]
MQALTLTLFAVTYAGMATGGLPGLQVDRAGIAIVAAIVLFAAGALGHTGIAEVIDFPTLGVLFGLMVLSAQFATSGFYDWCSSRIAQAPGSPARLLVVTVVIAGGLSAVLANDVVVFAMTPLLCRGLGARGLDPRPFLIALAAAANAGSAATIIGNPQNILIGQIGHLDFWRFVAVCGIPALTSLTIVVLVVWWVWRHRWFVPPREEACLPPLVNRRQAGKAAAATAILVVLLATPLPHESSVLLVAGALLLSRTVMSRDLLSRVDWPLLALFAGLFVVNGALTTTGAPARAIAFLAEVHLLPTALAVMTPLALVASNTVGNVPTVILLLAVWPQAPTGALYALALLSTLAGNLFLPGSLANLITAERAASVGYRLGFADHARCGVPITLLSMGIAVPWLWWNGILPPG